MIMSPQKIFTLIFIFLMTSLKMHAQQPNDYAKNWKAVEAFEKKGLTKSALQEVMKIFDKIGRAHV